jgi:ParB family chromosome partitioning protein
MSTSIEEIPLDKIKPPKFTLRDLDPAKVNELAQSVREHGVLQPLTVRPSQDGFQLVFGLHRLEACKKLCLKTVPCCVKAVGDADAFLLALTENLQRNEYIDPVREAEGFRTLLQTGMTEKEIGERIGRSQQYVSGRLQLLTLEYGILHQISKRIIPAEHGLELSKVQDSCKRRTLAELSRKDRDGSLNLQQLREASKKTLEELAVDPKVEWIIIHIDPAWGIWRLKLQVAQVEKGHLDLKARVDAQSSELDEFYPLNSRVTTLEGHGTWKRDHCTHNSGGVCQYWQWQRPPLDWSIVQDGDKWKVRVSDSPEYCATCPEYAKKQ